MRATKIAKLTAKVAELRLLSNLQHEAGNQKGIDLTVSLVAHAKAEAYAKAARVIEAILKGVD